MENTLRRQTGIGMRLVFGFGLVVLLLAAVAVLGVMRLREGARATDEIVIDRHVKVALALQIKNDVNDMARGLRNAALAQTPEDRKKFIGRMEQADRSDTERLRKLDVRVPATDPQLGIRADAVMLFRYADMLQWQERKNGDKVEYVQVWSPQLIDSSKFREADSHRNPTRLPFGIARFSSTDLRLGAFSVDGGVLGNSRNAASLHAQPQPHAVSASELPPNLAASFRDSDGMLYAGDPAHRAIGDIRVIYRVIPAGTVEITGTQRGDRIAPQKSVVVDH